MTASYWLFVDMLRDVFAFQPEDDDRARGERIVTALRERTERGDLAAERMDEMGPLFGNLLAARFGNNWDERLKNAGPEQIKHQTFLAVRDFLVTLAKRQPILLILEDLHWADSLSLDLILLLMETLTLAPLLLVCVYRPEREHKCWQLGTIAMQKHPEHYTEIMLRELTPTQGRRLVDSLLHIDSLPETVKTLILEKARGNPFFVEEVVRSLIDSGMIYREDETWKAKEGIEAVAVPESIQSVILSRVDRLSQELKRVLESASVIGRLFRRRLLNYVTQGTAELEQMLWQLEDRQLIYQERVLPEEEYSFKHVLTQETIYQNILKRRRAVFHRAVAEAIEALYGDSLSEFYEPLSQHWEGAGDREKCVDYLLRAAEKARGNFANEEAIGFYRYALHEGRNLETKTWRVEAHRGLGRTYHRMNRQREAAEQFRQAVTLGKEAGLPAHEIARLHWWLGDVLFWLRELDAMFSVCEEGLSLLGENEESAETAMMNGLLVNYYLLPSTRDRAKAWERYARYAPFLERLPYCEELRPAYLLAAWANVHMRNIEEAQRWLRALQQKAEQHHDLMAQAGVLKDSGSLLIEIGNFREGCALKQQARELYAKIGDVSHEQREIFELVWLLFDLGDIPQAEAYLALMQPKEGIGYLWHSGRLALCRGEPEQARKAFQQMLLLCTPENTWSQYRTMFRIGQTFETQGERQEAQRRYEESLERSCSLPESEDQMLALIRVSGCLEAVCETPEAFRAALDRLEQASPEFFSTHRARLLSEPAQIRDFPQIEVEETFTAPLSPEWVWHDPFADGAYGVENGLEIHAANGRDLYHLNLSAPRLLRPMSGDFAIQTVCAPASPDKPAIGGLLLWKDRDNFVRLERGAYGEHAIWMGGCIANKSIHIGRGRLQAPCTPRIRGVQGGERVFLRLERVGGRVKALCSADGKNWFTAGETEFPADGPVSVGLDALGMIDRLFYPGAFPDGTAIRFESFVLQSGKRH